MSSQCTTVACVEGSNATKRADTTNNFNIGVGFGDSYIGGGRICGELGKS